MRKGWNGKNMWQLSSGGSGQILGQLFSIRCRKKVGDLYGGHRRGWRGVVQIVRT